VYERHGAFYYVKRGKWLPLGRDLGAALHEYARIVAQPANGVPALIDQALPAITDKVATSTRKQYLSAAVKLRKHFVEFTPDQVRHADVMVMMDAYTKNPSIGNRLLTVLKQTFDWALERELVAHNPCARIKRHKQEARDRLISPAEFNAIREKAPARLQCIMDLCYLTGQRIGDVLAIKRADLDPEGIYFRQQKTGKKLVVAWSPELRAAVDRAKALTGNLAPLTLFYGRGGHPPVHQNVWRAFKSAAKKAGVQNATLHDLRAMSGTEAERQGEDPTALLGHTDSRTTKVYLRDKSAPVVTGPSFRRPIDESPKPTHIRRSRAR